MLKLLMAMNLVAGLKTFEGAAKSGQLHVLEWLLHLRFIKRELEKHAHVPPMHTFHLSTLKRDCNINLHSQVHPPVLEHLVPHAVVGGNLGVVTRLCTLAESEAGGLLPEWYESVLEEAATHDKVEIYKHFIAKNDHMHTLDVVNHTRLAARNGSFKVLQYLLDTLPEFNIDEAYYGWTEFQEGTEKDCGQVVELFKWLVDKAKMELSALLFDCVMTDCHNTANCIKLMEFLLSRNCPKAIFVQETEYVGVYEYFDLYTSAVMHLGLGALRRIEWLYAHNFPMLYPSSEAMKHAICENQLHLVQRMHEMGWTLTAEVVEQFKKEEWWKNNSCCEWAQFISGTHPARDSDADEWLNCPVEVERVHAFRAPS